MAMSLLEFYMERVHEPYVARYADNPAHGRRVTGSRFLVLLATTLLWLWFTWGWSPRWTALWCILTVIPLGFLAGTEGGYWLYWRAVDRGSFPNLGKGGADGD